ncbi:MAG TPA: nucleotidyltransferase domain-containing protein [Ramlibacter sp.]|uniref:nucleotidyltransferase family protein n=1 Tax=Ramlibacter sp. TaxID=1917967 RepID=UPI002C2E63CE|nr:nucleotidyltransferase domain-containing protein [Ramlibacter sp.]HVZ43182.1 nucleotidyltransferase domain-containing protein [Ramlibacter sp.]
MHAVISQKRDEISRICKEHHVRKLEVFGSAARGIDFDPEKSDADFLVEFEPETLRRFDAYFDVKEALEELLQRSVDLVEPDALKNPFVIASINRNREVVYAA